MKVTVTPKWLADHLDDPNVVVIDATWYLPNDDKTGLEQYKTAHIHGAQFFDIDQVAARDTDLPHMLPTPDTFTEAAQSWGVNTTSNVVVYDAAGLFSAARAWWTFKTMGHDAVYVLDGGLPAWVTAGHSTTTDVTPLPRGDFSAQPNPSSVATAHMVLNHAGPILDARPKARFDGTAAEPRAGLRSGHIPGSHNVFFKDLLTPDGQLKSADDLRQVFANIDLTAPIITSCGSGVTAAIITMALCRLDVSNLSLYDGSWAEWGADNDLPIETT